MANGILRSKSDAQDGKPTNGVVEDTATGTAYSYTNEIIDVAASTTATSADVTFDITTLADRSVVATNVKAIA